MTTHLEDVFLELSDQAYFQLTDLPKKTVLKGNEKTILGIEILSVRSGWLGKGAVADLNEISESDSSYIDSHDCGPDCEVATDHYVSYSVSIPAKESLKIVISAKINTDLYISTSFYSNDENSDYKILPSFLKNETETFRLTGLK